MFTNLKSWLTYILSPSYKILFSDLVWISSLLTVYFLVDLVLQPKCSLFKKLQLDICCSSKCVGISGGMFCFSNMLRMLILIFNLFVIYVYICLLSLTIRYWGDLCITLPGSAISNAISNTYIKVNLNDPCKFWKLTLWHHDANVALAINTSACFNIN